MNASSGSWTPHFPWCRRPTMWSVSTRSCLEERLRSSRHATTGPCRSSPRRIYWSSSPISEDARNSLGPDALAGPFAHAPYEELQLAKRDPTSWLPVMTTRSDVGCAERPVPVHDGQVIDRRAVLCKMRAGYTDEPDLRPSRPHSASFFGDYAAYDKCSFEQAGLDGQIGFGGELTESIYTFGHAEAAPLDPAAAHHPARSGSRRHEQRDRE